MTTKRWIKEARGAPAALPTPCPSPPIPSATVLTDRARRAIDRLTSLGRYEEDWLAADVKVDRYRSTSEAVQRRREEAWCELERELGLSPAGIDRFNIIVRFANGSFLAIENPFRHPETQAIFTTAPE